MIRIRIIKMLPLFAIVLASCVEPNYVKPSGQNTASITISTKTADSYNQQVRVYKDKDCADYPGQIINVLQSKIIGNDTKESTQTMIPGGQLLTLSVMAGVPRDDTFWQMFFKGIERTASENRHCEAFVTFIPEAGATYQAIYKIDGTPCSLNVMKIVNGQGITVTGARPNQRCSAAAKRKMGKQLFTN